MVEVIQQLGADLPLEKYYNWEIPTKPPIEIPPNIEGAFARNVFLKENLHKQLLADSDLTISYWIIQKWGGIETFKNTESNRSRIETFYNEIKRSSLTKDTFNIISSLSKLAAFRWPDIYSIYDSRAIFALNWLLFCHTENPMLFPQPSGRSRSVEDWDTNTLFRLSGRSYKMRCYKKAYFEYCTLMQDLAQKTLKQEMPYYIEMLLFVAAKDWIPQDIRKRTTVTINTNAQQSAGGNG